MDRKQEFKLAWEKELPSQELPSLDFLGNEEQAREQFRHSMAVIKDCLTTINLEVFIVKFLRSHLLSDEKSGDLNLALTIEDVVCKLDSIFPRRTRYKSDGAYYSQIIKAYSGKNNKRTNIKGLEFPNYERVVDADKISPSSLNNEIEKRDHTTLPCAVTTDETNGHTEKEPNIDNERNVTEEIEAVGEGLRPAINESENLTSEATLTTTELSGSALTTPQTPEKADQVTIFSPIEDKYIDFKANLSTVGEIQPSPVPRTDTVATSDDTSVAVHDGESSQTANIGEPPVEEPDEVKNELLSSGNELDVSDNSSIMEEHDNFSSDSGSTCASPQRERYLGHDTLPPSSDEILNIMPLSSRFSFYSVDPLSENTRFDTAEHIYEDIDKIRLPLTQDKKGQLLRHVPQPGPSLRKTLSVGGIQKKKDDLEDVFVNDRRVSEGKVFE